MQQQIKLTKEDISFLKERLQDPSIPTNEKDLLRAIVKMAADNPVHGQGDVAWIFIWQPPQPAHSRTGGS